MKALWLVIVLLLAGCSTVRPLVLHEGHPMGEPDRSSPDARTSRTSLDSPQSVVGYATTDGRSRRFSGFVERIGDSLVFSRPTVGYRVAAYTKRRVLTLAAKEVEVLEITRPARVRTLLTIGFAVGVGTALTAILVMGGGARID